MIAHTLYRVETRDDLGWKLGMSVWMKPEHFRSFVDAVPKLTVGESHNIDDIRVRRDLPINCHPRSFLWDGHTLRSGEKSA